MKKVIEFNPVFDPALKTLDFSGMDGFELKKLYAVINETKSQIIYSMASKCYGYTDLTGSVLELQYNTASHSPSDILSVIYDEQDENLLSSVFDVVSSSVIYTGQARRSSATSSPVWLIKKIEISGPSITILNASLLHDQIWDDRSTLTYV